MTRFLAVLCVRNEAAFLLDWLAHHKVIGFTDFLVFSNDCDDGTDHLLAALDAAGVITHVDHKGPFEGGVQWAAMKQADKHPLVRQADWILALDIDEYVNIHIGDGKLGDLIAALPEADAITLTWRLFGNADVQAYVDKPVTEQFTRAAPRVMYWPWRAAMFKTFFRNNGTYRKLGIHRPKSPDPNLIDQVKWFDGSARRLPERFHKKQIFSPFGRENYGLVQLNHYPLGAMESYVLKADRGRGVHADDQLGMSYWLERNWVDEEDTSILRHTNSAKKERARLAELPGVAELHAAAVQWRKDRFDTLMKLEEPRALYGRLLMSQPARALSLEQARALFQHAQLDTK